MTPHNMNASQKSQLTSIMTGMVVAGAVKRGEITEAQAEDILNAAAFASHCLTTLSTLETLINSANAHDAPPFEIVLVQFVLDAQNEVRPALDRLQNLLEMLQNPKETPAP